MAITAERQPQQAQQTLFWVELVCARCSATRPGQWVARQIPVRQMKGDARAAGWVFSRVHSFCSTFCRKRFDADEYPEDFKN